MRVHFQKTPWDLIATVCYAVVTSIVLLVANVGNLVAIFLVLFVPGYVLVAALFPAAVAPEKPKMNWLERIVISFAFSIAVVPLLGLLLNFTPFGIRFAPIVSTIALFTVGVGGVAYWRRMKLPPERRLSATLDLSIPAWKEYSRLDKSLTVALAMSTAVAAITVGYAVLLPRHGETFTVFYILGSGGSASGYPSALNLSQNGSVILAIEDHESATVNYTVRIDLVGVQFLRNGTSGNNETVEVNRTTLSTFSVTLASGQNWTQPYTFAIQFVGLWKVQFLLFKNQDFSSAYRELQLYVTVS